MDELKVEPDSDDESEVIDIKVEDTADVKQEEDPLLITLPVTDAAHEVSCRSVCLVKASHNCPDMPVMLASFMRRK
jgi:hypothetical protein